MTVFTSLSSMSAIDLEEIKDVISRSAAEYALLEESVTQISTEREDLRNKVGQLEILLKSRQAALLNREEECQSLRQQVVANSQKALHNRMCSLTRYTDAVFDSIKECPVIPQKFSPWLSVSRGIASVFIQSCAPISKPVLSFDYVNHINEYVETSPSPALHLADLNRSPPRTVYRTNESRRSLSSSSESLSPRYAVVPSRMQRSLDRYRDSFATVRSSRTVQSIESDSDESLDELVSHAMRLSNVSGRSSTSSSVVRGSVVMRASTDSTRSDRSSFPKRWK